MDPQVLVYETWFAWIASWYVAALWSSPTVKRPGLSWGSFYRIPETLGFVLLIGTFGYYRRGQVQEFGYAQVRGVELWSAPQPLVWAMAALCVCGFLFAWWARLHLGRLWSGTVTRKEGHRVVDSGPYALVRHPIYTGILIAAAATVVAQGTTLAVAGAALLLAGFWLKARHEEGFLRAELGTEAYDAYAARTPMLVPFVGR